MRDLTLREALDAFTAFAASVGPKATCTVYLGSLGITKGLTTASFQPKGYGAGEPSFWLHADTFRDLLTAVEAKWAEHSDLHATNTVRSMALAIIAITADQGECSDAALRAKFDAADIKRYGEQACAQATEMASNGPFSIVSLSGANDVGQAA